ncbi:cAMP-responsive element modulator-like isoform X2 [Salmo trutta]|uniref:cAMP-responsive element modulator-like isoform X2 n=1 Tax=Salmo trutta TaxID=8032 RepID=UPI0011300E21|nr:cAMP-responsive element modulator-like isoform X2 [Salmo trutta]
MRMKTNVHFFKCTNARCEVGILKYIRTIIMASNACQMQEHGSSGSLSSLAQVATRRAKSEDRNSNEDVSNAHNRRELPSRRQPYRKVSSDPAGPKVEEIKEEVAPCSVPPGPGMPASIYQTNHGQFIAFTQDGAIQLTSALPRGLQALQPLTMSNSGNPQSAAAIVQYSQQSGDGTQQFYMQGNKVMVKASTGDMSGYQICTPTSSLPQGVVMAGSPGSLHSPPHVADETTRKRQLRLMKNREAARECRRKKKEYVKCLENRVAVLENQNRTLIEELKALKDIYCHKVE